MVVMRRETGEVTYQLRSESMFGKLEQPLTEELIMKVYEVCIAQLLLRT